MLTLYRKLLALRRAEPALHAGPIEAISAEGNILRYRRTDPATGKRFQLLFNFAANPEDHAITHCKPGRVLLTTLLDGEGARVGGEGSHLTLEAGEGLLIALD